MDVSVAFPDAPDPPPEPDPEPVPDTEPFFDKPLQDTSNMRQTVANVKTNAFTARPPNEALISKTFLTSFGTNLYPDLDLANLGLSFWRSSQEGSYE